jgi:MYXO-CTERM domain-containing protein
MTSIEGNLALSTEGLADFTGFLDYQFLGGNQGQLTVTLTNTTDPAKGGYLTAFMFRTPESFGGFTSSLVSSTYAGMTNIPAGSSGSPFPGAWLGGAGLGATWLGGGSPNGGVAVGSTGQWVFSITGVMASALDAVDFVDGDAYAFIVRFRGLNDDCSDKVPAVTPAPGAVALAGAAGLLGGRRRRD